MSNAIAIFLPSLAGGGVEKVMVTLANQFSEAGHNVDLILVDAKGPYLTDVSDEVRIVELGSSRVIAAVPKLICYLRKNRPRVMLTAMHYVNVAAVFARAIAMVNTRLVISECANYSLSRANSQHLIVRHMGKIMKWAYPQADALIAVSAGVADDLAKQLSVPRGDIQVIYNPIYSEDLLHLSYEAVQHRWFQQDNVPVILGVGRLTAQKNFAFLIRAFAQLLKQKDARLVILGDGPERDNLQTLINELGIQGFVDMPGFVDNPYAYMRRAKLFVLSSGWEGLGNVLVEAMSCGTSVISTDCQSGPAEILEHGKWGQLVPLDDQEKMVHAMNDALENKMPLNVVERARDFHVSLAAQKYLQVMLPWLYEAD